MAVNAAVSPVAVIGCGTVGAAWAALFSASGFEVRVFDPAITTAAELDARIAPAMAALRELGMSGTGAIELRADLAAACDGAGFVQENTREDLAFKVGILAQLDAVAPPEAIIASSTSSLLLSQMTAEVANPGRVIIAHPFNPAHLVPLVELFEPDAAVVARAAAFYRALGKVPVVLKREAQGHIANRLSSALFREAVHLVAEGIASVEDVDTTLREGPGLRWSILGVHLGYHLGAGRGGIRQYLDHLGASQQRRWDDLGRPELTPEVREALTRAIEAAYGDRSTEALEAARDAELIARIKARQPATD